MKNKGQGRKLAITKSTTLGKETQEKSSDPEP